LNGKMPMWTRVYMPKNAEVIETLGFDNDSVQQGEEFDKKVIEGSFTLMPESQAKIKIVVKIPKTGDNYRLFIQKQPGTKNSPYSIRLGGREETFELTGDKEVTIPLQ